MPVGEFSEFFCQLQRKILEDTGLTSYLGRVVPWKLNKASRLLCHELRWLMSGNHDRIAKLKQNGWKAYFSVLSFAALSCKNFSRFLRFLGKSCGYKIGEVRKPLLEAIWGKGFKLRGYTYLFPVRGRKLRDTEHSDRRRELVTLTSSP
jgi:hypothetical protein